MTERALPGQIGRYGVLRPLGQGAMGRVLLAHDPILDRDVAIKLLRDDLNIPSEQRLALLERMRQEARASARVSHPNIVALHDMGEDAKLGLYLVFEFLDGETLKDRLTRGQLGPEACARLARQLGDALTTAHKAGVLHRDIKPENIILSRTGAKIADFGIARLPDSTLTRDGGLLGTPAYSAPEAIASAQFSPLSDQFSLAATLYEAICLRRAFPGEDAVAVASRIATDEPPPIAEVCGLDSHVDAVLLRALSKHPRARFDTCEEFGHALAEALTLSSRTSMPTLPDSRHREPLAARTGSRGTRIALGGLAIGAVLAVIGFQLRGHLQPANEPDFIRYDASAPVAPEPSTTAIGYLAERPPERRRRRAAGAGSSAPQLGGDAAPATAPNDASTPSVVVDAGLLDAATP
ncbi:MAG TPA: serine/threonine-protein kinase [Polyangiaceae bacterium]|nr:serine/threonine-protein kinase [Polyangiaceae bacterium]